MFHCIVAHFGISLQKKSLLSILPRRIQETPLPKIPGLPPQAQAKAIERQMKRDSDKKKDKKGKNKGSMGEGADEALFDEVVVAQNAFEILMNRNKKTDQAEKTSTSLLIPDHCNTSPELRPKRTADLLGSPNSPEENISKKNKTVKTPTLK